MLVVDTVLGNVHDDETLALDVQRKEKDGTATWVALAAHEAQRRRIRAATTAGGDVGIDVPRGTRLRDGDVLCRGGGRERLVVISVAPSEAMEIRLTGEVAPEDLFAFGVRLGHVLGNQHWPLRVERDRVLAPVTIDRLVMEKVLATHGFDELSWTFVPVAPGEVPTGMPHVEHRHD